MPVEHNEQRQGGELSTTTHGWYVCPNCKRQTYEMDLSSQRYYPTDIVRMTRSVPKAIEHEILLCPCGETHSWFTVEEVMTEEALTNFRYRQKLLHDFDETGEMIDWVVIRASFQYRGDPAKCLCYLEPEFLDDMSQDELEAYLKSRFLEQMKEKWARENGCFQFNVADGETVEKGKLQWADYLNVTMDKREAFRTAKDIIA